MEVNRSIVVFNHGVERTELQEIIPANFQGDIIIYGNLSYDYSRERESFCELDISGNLWVDGDIDMEDAFLKVDGDLICTGSIIARELTANNIECYHELRVRRQLIADDVFCNMLNAYIVNVDGDVVCNTSEIDTMNVFGNYICFKKAQVEGATVHGNCICEGNISTICLIVLQNLLCDGFVHAYKLTVFGNVKIAVLYSNDAKVGGELEYST